MHTVEDRSLTVRQEPDNDMGRSCDVCINAHVMCMWPPGKRRACFECMCRHDKCLIDSKLVMQRAPCSSGLKKKRVQVVSQPAIEEVSEEAAVEELTRKEVMPEEATIKVDALVEGAAPEEATIEVDVPVEGAAPEEVPVVNAPPCLEELAWATL